MFKMLKNYREALGRAAKLEQRAVAFGLATETDTPEQLRVIRHGFSVPADNTTLAAVHLIIQREWVKARMAQVVTVNDPHKLALLTAGMNQLEALRLALLQTAADVREEKKP